MPRRERIGVEPGGCGDESCTVCFETFVEEEPVPEVRVDQNGGLYTEPVTITPADPPEQVRCSYVGTCLRRNRDGMVPALRPDGTRTTIHCGYCGGDYCTQHNHTRRSNPEYRCTVCGDRQPACRMPEECGECGSRMCPDCNHIEGGYDCDAQREQNDNSEYGEDMPNGYYRGPYREAELLFNGDDPVPGLAEGERYASVELEAEIRAGQSGRLSLPVRFGITTDGSLRNGIEVTLPPARMEALVDNVRTATAALQAGGYYAASSCGSHVHIDLRDKQEDPRFLSRLFATFFAIEDVLFAMQRSNRHQSNYCAPIRNGWSFYDTYGKKAPDFEFVYYKKTKSLMEKMAIDGMKQYKSGPRYHAFNFHSVYYRGSLEVRLHEGTLDADEILKFIDLLQFVIAKVDKGITWQTLKRLVSMDVSAKKIGLMKRVFGLSDDMVSYVKTRIVSAHGTLSFRLRWREGTPERGRPTLLLPTRRFRATHRRCRWCMSITTLERRCSYCRREAAITRGDEYGERDEVGMFIGTRRAGQFVTEQEFSRFSGIRVQARPISAAVAEEVE